MSIAKYLPALMLGLLVVVAGHPIAEAQQRTPRHWTGPTWTSPEWTSVQAGGRCPSNMRLAMYQGRQACIRCGPGFAYTRYQGRDACVRCPQGYAYGTYRNMEVCIQW